MPLTRINGRDGTAAFTIAAVDYKTVLTFFDVEERVAMDPSSVFSTEGQADQEPGMSQLFFEIRGLGTKGAPESGPLIPAPQDVALVATVSTGCTLSFNANFDRARITRVVNQQTLISASGMSKKTYTKSWVVA